MSQQGSKYGLLSEYDVKTAVEKALESTKGKWHEMDTVRMAVMKQLELTQRRLEKEQRWQSMLGQLPEDLKHAMADHRAKLEDLDRRQGETWKRVQAAHATIEAMNWMLFRILHSPELCKAMPSTIEQELKQLLYNSARHYEKEKDWCKP